MNSTEVLSSLAAIAGGLSFGAVVALAVVKHVGKRVLDAVESIQSYEARLAQLERDSADHEARLRALDKAAQSWYSSHFKESV